jgi:uncharacterized repeat protein (TIGR03803 family)
MTKLNWMTKACGVFLLWTAAAVALPAQTFTSLYSFDGIDGLSLNAGLLQGTSGNLYGTTAGGGANGGGTVYSITPSGTLTTLLSFDDTDGATPYAAPVQAINGNYYGTANRGGANGEGTIFKMTPSGILTTLYSFCSQGGSACTDGAFPYAGVVNGTDGNFYGTTHNGGASSYGTVFKITPNGTLTTLHSFGDTGTDGAYPYAGLAQAANGDFYGTTWAGGTQDDGTVFKITSSGTLTVLYTFCSQVRCIDGTDPYGGLVEGTDGNFYGTTYNGGANGEGTVFKMTPTGTLTTLHSFDDSDGANPYAGLVQATDGDLYGTTYYGGANGDGTVFKMTPSGSLTTLYDFCSLSGCTDGSRPSAPLVQATNGEFYGTTIAGGSNINDYCASGCGTVFSLNEVMEVLYQAL